MHKKVLLIGLIIVSSILVGCGPSKKPKKTKEQIVVAKVSVPVKHLYFNGVIQPIATQSVLSPVDGRIEKLNFIYGQKVVKGQLLAIVNSLKLMDSFRQAVSSFLQKKSDYLTQTQNFQGTKVLYKAGVIDGEQYTSEKSTYENSVLAFFQEEYELKKVLLKAGVKPQEIEKLSISDVDKIKILFARQFNHIRVYAPSSGVALFPIPQQGQSGSSSSDSSSDSSGAIIVGSSIREAQLILSIGNLAGFAIDTNVNEVNVNSVHKDMKAIITGDAFPGIVLNGKVEYVASQAQPDQSGDSSGSTFKVTITVPHVNPKDLASVHVGMTAKVDLPIKGAPRIMLPINAVFRKDGKSYVTIVGTDGKRQDVAVVTGSTTPSDVVIVDGVKQGQKVVVRDTV